MCEPDYTVQDEFKSAQIINFPGQMVFPPLDIGRIWPQRPRKGHAGIRSSPVRRRIDRLGEEGGDRTDHLGIFELFALTVMNVEGVDHFVAKRVDKR